MTPQKVLEVLKKYEEHLVNSAPVRIEADVAHPIFSGHGSGNTREQAAAEREVVKQHLHWMCVEAQRVLQASLDSFPGGTTSAIEKAMRWLGFIQGVFFCLGTFSLEDMKRDNMKPGEEFNINA